MNSINIGGQVKWKTCVLIRVTIFSPHLLIWWYWTWQHIRSHYFFVKLFLINRTWPFLHKCLCWGFILSYFYNNYQIILKITWILFTFSIFFIFFFFFFFFFAKTDFKFSSENFLGWIYFTIIGNFYVFSVDKWEAIINF